MFLAEVDISKTAYFMMPQKFSQVEPEPVRRTGSGSTIDEKLNFKNVPQKFTEDTTCKYWYCR